jgi:hypothetical protein
MGWRAGGEAEEVTDIGGVASCASISNIIRAASSRRSYDHVLARSNTHSISSFVMEALYHICFGGHSPHRLPLSSDSEVGIQG